MVNARLEEMSFRSGATVSASVLAVAGGAIALAVTLGGGHAEATSAPVASSAPRPPASFAAPASPSPLASPTRRPKPRHTTPPVSYQAPPQEVAASTPSPDPGDTHLGPPRPVHPSHRPVPPPGSGPSLPVVSPWGLLHFRAGPHARPGRFR